MSTSNTIIIELFSELDLLLHNYVYNGYNALAHALKYPLGLAITLYIVILGMSIMHGWVKVSMGNFVKSALKIGLIYVFAMNWSFFSDYAVQLIQGGAGDIGNVLIKATPMAVPDFENSGINGAMQLVLTEFTTVGDLVWNKGGFSNISPYFTAIVIWGFGYALILVSVFELALAKIMLSILFATAPLFVSFTLFKPTHGFFDRWLGAIVGFGLLLIFVSAMLALALSVAQWAIVDMFASKAAGVNLVGYVPVMVVGFLGIGIILRASNLAQSIGGAVTTSSASSLLAGTIGGAVGGTFATLKLPANIGNSMRSLYSPIGALRNKARGGK